MSAAQALISLGMEDALAAVLEMCLKHLLADPPRDMEEDPTSGPLHVSTQDMYKAVRGFKPGSGPDLSDLLGYYLKETG